MRPALRTKALGLARPLLSTALLLAASASAAPTPVKPAIHAAPTDPAASALPPEVRLRKLHLVRPDLILYPISYDVYC